MDAQIINFNQEELAEKSKKVYDEKLKDILETDHKGEIVAINHETGDYFLGKTVLEAVKKGKKKFPNATFLLYENRISRGCEI